MAVSKVPSKQLGFRDATSSGTVAVGLDCDSSVYVGAAVYLDSGIIKNAIATSLDSSYVIGFCYNKQSSVICDIILGGLTQEIFSGLDTSKIQFLSDVTAGGLQSTPVTTTGNYLISLGKPLTTKKLIIEIGQLYRRS